MHADSMSLDRSHAIKAISYLRYCVLKVRMKLNSLTEAFGRRSTDQATSHSVHRLTTGIFALNNALEQGKPFAQQKVALKQSSGSDNLISLAVASLPEAESNQVGILDLWQGGESCSVEGLGTRML